MVKPRPDLDELERIVAKMRALGVREWGDIVLGDPPGPEDDDDNDLPDGLDDTPVIGIDEHPDTFSGYTLHLKRRPLEDA